MSISFQCGHKDVNEVEETWHILSHYYGEFPDKIRYTMARFIDENKDYCYKLAQQLLTRRNIDTNIFFSRLILPGKPVDEVGLLLFAIIFKTQIGVILAGHIWTTSPLQDIHKCEIVLVFRGHMKFWETKPVINVTITPVTEKEHSKDIATVQEINMSPQSIRDILMSKHAESEATSAPDYFSMPQERQFACRSTIMSDILNIVGQCEAYVRGPRFGTVQGHPRARAVKVSTPHSTKLSLSRKRKRKLPATSTTSIVKVPKTDTETVKTASKELVTAITSADMPVSKELLNVLVPGTTSSTAGGSDPEGDKAIRSPDRYALNDPSGSLPTVQPPANPSAQIVDSAVIPADSMLQEDEPVVTSVKECPVHGQQVNIPVPFEVNVIIDNTDEKSVSVTEKKAEEVVEEPAIKPAAEIADPEGDKAIRSSDRYALNDPSGSLSTPVTLKTETTSVKRTTRSARKPVETTSPAKKVHKESKTKAKGTVTKSNIKADIAEENAEALGRRTRTVIVSEGSTCKYCKKKFSTRNALVKHEQSHVDYHYSCEECGKLFQYPSQLEEHNRKHTGELIACTFPKCDRKFVAKRSMLHHLRTHTAKKIECQVCDFKTTTNANMIQHMRGYHGEGWNSKCGLKFSSPTGLAAHNKTDCKACEQVIIKERKKTVNVAKQVLKDRKKKI